MDRSLGFLALLVAFMLIVAAQFFYGSPSPAPQSVGGVPPQPIEVRAVEVLPAPAWSQGGNEKSGPFKETVILEDCGTAKGEDLICIETGAIRRALEAVKPTVDIHSNTLKIGQTYGTTFSLNLDPAAQAGLSQFEDGIETPMEYDLNAAISFTSDAFTVTECIEGTRRNRVDFYCNVRADKIQDSRRLIARLSYYASTRMHSFAVPPVIVDLSDSFDISHTWQDKVGAFVTVYKPLVLGIGAILATLLTWVSGFRKLFQPPERKQDTKEA